MGAGKQALGPFQEQFMLLATDPSLQSQLAGIPILKPKLPR